MTNRFVEYILTEARKKDDQITALTEQIRKQNERLESLSEMRSELSSFRKEISGHLRTIRKLREQLDYAKETRFGDRRQRLKGSSASKGTKDKREDEDRRDDGGCSDGVDRTQDEDAHLSYLPLSSR